MIALGEFLEDFSVVRSPVVPMGLGVDETEIESRRLAAFEEGYRAGWEDADKNATEASSQLAHGVAQKLQDLSFTYQEAYTHMIGAVGPVFEGVVETLLPALVKETLSGHVSEALRNLAENIGKLPVTIAVSEQNYEPLNAMIEGQFAFSLEVIVDGSLTDDQVDIRFGETEKQIDFGDVIQTVRDAVQGFAHENIRTLSNG